MVSYPSSSESSFDPPGTPKAILCAKAVYVPPIDLVNSDPGGGESGDFFMSGNARGGSDQRPGSSAGRRRHSQQRRQPTSYPEASPAAPQQGYHAPVYAAAYPPPHTPYPGQYMMPPPPHTPTYSYPPAFHVPEQPHPSYPALTYPQYSPDPAAGPSFRYPSPMSPTYAQYSPQPASFSPGALYSHQHQHPQQHVYPGSAYPYHQHQHQHQHPHSPGGAQEGDGTWWYVPPPLPSPHTPQPPPYFYAHPAPPQHAPPHPGDGDGDASPTHASTPSPSHSSGLSGPASLGRPIVRRSYHPNPPAHRSEWVMWVGNVPSDAGHDEMWRFFSQPPDGDGGGGGSSSSSSVGAGDGAGSVLEGSSGVLSIFLISRSSCAFVNYETDAHLQAAISRFNGVPLRPDPRCARLVCRVRRKDDDLRAGVGAQRGMGMHMRWVKANSKAQRRADSASPPSVSDPGTPSSSSDAAHSLPPSVSALSLGSSDDEARPPRPPPRPQAGSSSSDSLASTNSSFLRLHFPQRFFILKSLTRDDLDLSVQTGLWATQRHNEGILDRAFRTSKDIFLIFSVNKSGEFYGYARMAGPIVGGESSGESSRVPWARRDDTSSPITGRGAHANPGDDAPPAPTPAHTRLFSPTHYVGTSPQPMSAAAATPGRAAHSRSAPAVLGKPHRNISGGSTAGKFSLDYLQRAALQLDESAPFRMRRDAGGEGEGEGGEVPKPGPGPVPGPMLLHSASGPALHSVPEEAGEPGAAAAREEGWGQDFKLAWICTERLPFVRTRHIRNPWNHDREVKVSRDGTELEPSVGQALLDEWRAYLEEEQQQPQQPPPPPPPASTSASEAGSARSYASASAPRAPRAPARGPGGPPRS
ncbi:YT521-B-like domain-containing protein [Mycena pura]|uniref:YT521-B-like domain-containing protein n=1 Tax=Mycena pura TaxID=153505 RepID=A0AAD6VJV4_9AGAR|nr:YT521-B-like domain-containing protein [Mycena pura]